MKDKLSPPAIPFRSDLERDIIKVLLYFDVFNHPLHPKEIYRYLPSNSTNPQEIRHLCLDYPLIEYVSHREDLFHLKSANSTCVEERFTKERIARRRWMIAKLVAQMIKRFPFVRAVFVSGELSKGVATKEGDVDFFIITANNRLWICRTLLILFKKIFFLNNKKYFCLNHFITESNLTVTNHDLYSALEIATLQPLHNLTLYHKYLRTNSWIFRYFPNLSIPEAPARSRDRRSVLQRIFEIPLRGRVADSLDRWLMVKWRRLWVKRYPHLTDQKRREIFRCERDISTAYAGDFLLKVLGAYHARLKQHGIASA